MWTPDHAWNSRKRNGRFVEEKSSLTFFLGEHCFDFSLNDTLASENWTYNTTNPKGCNGKTRECL